MFSNRQTFSRPFTLKTKDSRILSIHHPFKYTPDFKENPKSPILLVDILLLWFSFSHHYDRKQKSFPIFNLHFLFFSLIGVESIFHA